VGHPVAVDLNLTGELCGHHKAPGSGNLDLDAEPFEILVMNADHSLITVLIMIVLDSARS
jgi:hypothetical protein